MPLWYQEIAEHYGRIFVHIQWEQFQFKLWENVKLVLRKNPLYERDDKGNAFYLEAVAITFFRQAKWFLQFIQISFNIASYK
jgi:hypothetical protein